MVKVAGWSPAPVQFGVPMRDLMKDAACIILTAITALLLATLLCMLTGCTSPQPAVDSGPSCVECERDPNWRPDCVGRCCGG